METFDVTDISSPKNLSILFRVSMWWRIIYGVLRLFVGTALLQLIGQPLSEPIYTLMAHEITGKTGDAVLEHIYTLFETHNFTISYFIAMYFIFWGTVDILLSICLLRHIKKAFPITMMLIVFFIIYSIFRLTHTHSAILLGVILLDIFILYLISTEYRKFKQQ